MYPSIKCIAVDRFKNNKKWISELIDKHNIEYYEIQNDSSWYNELDDKSFDVIIEATGNPQKVIENAIKVLAPNGALALLSVMENGSSSDKISPSIFRIKDARKGDILLY